MSKTEKLNEEQVFKQALDDDELDAVSGGTLRDYYGDCINDAYRDIYGGQNGFPNCAATVEEDSWCWSNDACLEEAVVYKFTTKSCLKAWE